MKAITTILILLFFLPLVCNASFGLSPAKISFEEKNFKAGETYFLKPNIQISNSDPVERKIVMSVECWKDKECIDKNWITFEPERFTLAPNSAQEVQVAFKAPRNISNKEYGKKEFILQAKLDKGEATPTERTKATFSTALGVKVSEFHLAGKLPAHKALLNSLNDKIFSKLSASLASLGLHPKTLGIIFGGMFILFLIERVLRFLFRRRKRKKVIPQTNIQEKFPNRIDLREMIKK